MANLTITAANVVAGTSAKTSVGTAGATITAGQALYRDDADSSKLKPAAANAVATENVVGIALNGASNNQPVAYVTEDDDFTPGATLDLAAAGAKGVYVLSATPGAICPVGDLVATNRLVCLMVAKSTTKAKLKISAANAAIA